MTRTPRHDVTVVATRLLTPRMRRITVAAPSLVGLRPRPSQDVELVLDQSCGTAEPSGRRVKRRYTISAARPDVGQFDLDVLLHGNGPGAMWGAQADPGDSVSFFGPRGKLAVTDAEWQLFVGDESALPAIASLVAALPADQHATVLAEVGTAADELPLGRPDGAADVQWLHRGSVPPGTAELFATALAQLHPRAETCHAYLLGETRAVIALRPELQRLGIDAAQTFVKGYWNVGRDARISR